MAAKIIPLPTAAPARVKNPPYGVKLWRDITRIPSFGVPQPTPSDAEKIDGLMNTIELCQRTVKSARARINELKKSNQARY
ncbi:MAG: hypothetical protein WAW73_17815 [Rhodoferax sp.]